MSLKLESRNKYKGFGKTINKGEAKVNVNFDINTLVLMCSYVLTDNKHIRRAHLINMRNLFEMLDLNIYKADPTRMKYINFIKKALQAKLEENINNPAVIIKYINGGIVEDNEENVIDIEEFITLSTSELEWISKTISEALKYSYIYNDVDELYDMLVRFKACDYANRGAIVSEIEQQVIKMNNLFRKARVENAQEVTFSLRDGIYEEAMREIHDQLTNPSCRLYTGMQGFNELIGGALETQRVYMLLGLAGAGKSLSLLNIAKQIKNNNKHFRTKDPTKTPVIVILTMENSVKESVERLFEITTGKDIKNYSAEEAIKMMKEEGELYLSDESPIDIVIKYMPNRSVDTSYLYTMTEDLEDEGYEVICVIQDHIKRIRSVEKSNEIRLELGSIVNEFKTFSMMKDCVVITNSHLNREAAKTIDDGLRDNKADLLRMLGRANIGESMLMLDNLDVAILISKESDKDGNVYMGFKRIKERIKVNPNVNIIYQPFESKESLKLTEDLGRRVPVHKYSLRDEVNIIGGINNNLNTVNNDKYNTLDNNSNNLLANEFNMFDYKNSIPTKPKKKIVLHYEPR